MKKLLFLFTILLLKYDISHSQQLNPDQAFPKIAGYVSVIHPLVAFDKKGPTYNFSNSYTVGFPMGVNILKNNKIGFSFELSPYIKFQKDTSKMSNLVFHPGMIFRFKHGFTFISRLAFETSGRYGITPVFNQVLYRSKNVNYFAALSTPLRFGNTRPVSIGLSLQLGVSF